MRVIRSKALVAVEAPGGRDSGLRLHERLACAVRKGVSAPIFSANATTRQSDSVRKHQLTDTPGTQLSDNSPQGGGTDSMPGGTDTMERTIGILPLSFLSPLVGLVAGGGAVAFRGLIGLIHNLMFLGTFSFFLRRSPVYPR